MSRKLSFTTFLIAALGLALMVFTASRTVHFVQLTLPPSQAGLAWFALAALDVGLVLWTLHFVQGARGFQRWLAGGMIGLDIVAVFALILTDSLYVLGEMGFVEPLAGEVMAYVTLGFSVVIALTLASGVLDFVLAPRIAEQMREEEAEESRLAVEHETRMRFLLTDQRAQKAISDAALEQHERNVRAIAETVAVGMGRELTRATLLRQGLTPEDADRFAGDVTRRLSAGRELEQPVSLGAVSLSGSGVDGLPEVASVGFGSNGNGKSKN